EASASSSVIHTPSARKRQLAVTTPKSKSTVLGRRTEESGERGSRAPERGLLLHRRDDPRFILPKLWLDFLLHRACPFQERVLVLVDRHADGRRLLRAVLAVVVLWQHGELLQLATHRDPRHAVDRHRIGALGQHFFDRRDPGACHTAQL